MNCTEECKVNDDCVEAEGSTKESTLLREMQSPIRSDRFIIIRTRKYSFSFPVFALILRDFFLLGLTLLATRGYLCYQSGK